MISLSAVQAAFIATLKADAVVLALLSDTKEIRENQWQGKDFIYPAIRVDMQTAVPIAGTNCEAEMVELDIQFYTEDTFSKNCDDGCAVIATKYHAKSFSSGGVKFGGMIVTVVTAARRTDQQTWMGKVHLRGSIS